MKEVQVQEAASHYVKNSGLGNRIKVLTVQSEILSWIHQIMLYTWLLGKKDTTRSGILNKVSWTVIKSL